MPLIRCRSFRLRSLSSTAARIGMSRPFSSHLNIRSLRKFSSSSSSGTNSTTTTTTTTTTKTKNGKSVGAASAPILAETADVLPSSWEPPAPMKLYPLPYAASLKRTVPPHIIRPPYADTGHVPYTPPYQVVMHMTPEQVEPMRQAAQLARRGLEYVSQLAVPGVTTDELDAALHNFLISEYDAYPSPLNYHGFPKSLCTSINEVICHGIPDGRPLQVGDVASFDVSCYIGAGVHGDNCGTIIVGDIGTDDDAATNWLGTPLKTDFESAEQEEYFRAARRLVKAAEESLQAGIDACKPGALLTDIGRAIHAVADEYGYETNRKYRGHGISSTFHHAPFVAHYRVKDNEEGGEQFSTGQEDMLDANDRLVLKPGMIFTIEPMLHAGKGSGSFEWDDQWTVATSDGSLSAQFEHTVLITDTGVEILTLLPANNEDDGGAATTTR